MCLDDLWKLKPWEKEIKRRNAHAFKFIFLAPTGAQEMLMYVQMFVRMFGSSLSIALNLHHSGSNLQAISQE